MGTANLGNVKLGDRVRTINSDAGATGRIVELRGPLGPNSIQVYRILLQKKPRRAYVEVREDQLELLDAK